MKAYADSSFIVALYLQEPNSGEAITLLERYARALPYTPWHRLMAEAAGLEVTP